MKRSCMGLLFAFCCLVTSPIPSRSQGLASPSRILPDDPVSRITPCDRGQVKGNAGGFEIDGNLIVDQAGGPSFDWFAFPSGAIGPIDPANCMMIDPDRFQFSAYDRDGGEAATIDPTVFSNVSNKNNDDISTAQGWNWIAGNGQPLRNDIGDVFGTIVTSIDPQTQQTQTWLVMAAAIRTPRGEGHIDFEVNRAGFVQNGATQGKIYGLGPDRGRTKARDLVISMDFRRGGAEAIASARMWNGTEFCPFDDRVCLQNNGIAPPPDGAWFAATNCATASMPCLTTDAQGLEVQNYGERQFVEAAVNLTRLGIVLDNPEAAHVLVKTGTSDSFTSDLQDFSLMGFKKPRKPPACPSIVATPDGKLACGASVTLCAPPPAPGTKYQWSSPGLVISQPESSCVTVKLDDPGPRTFYLDVSAVDDHRCASKCSFKVYVDCVEPLCPKIYASADPITLGESVRLCFTPDPALKYRWGCGSRLVISEPDSSCITVTPPDTGVVTCQLKVMQKADTTKFVYCPFSFRVKPPVCKIACPTPTLYPGDKITLGQSIRICVPYSSSVSYRWTSPQFPVISEPDSTCITITPTQTGVVNLNLKTKLKNNSSCYVNCPIVIVVNCPAMTCPPIAATPSASIRLGGTVTLCTPPNSTLFYRWSSPDGAVAEPDSVCMTVTPLTPGPHVYRLKTRLKADTTCSVECPYTVDVGARSPVCAVNPIRPDRTLACGDTATYCGSLQEPPLSGAIVTYEWTIVGGQILTAPSAACVQVKAGQATEFKLTLKVTLSGTPPGEPCSITVPLLAPKCEVLAVEPTRTLACGDTATYYVTISPPGGTLVYQWTIVGGTLETSPIASYVRVRAGNGGQFTLSVTTKRNNCPVSCERIVALTPLKCDILPFNPSRALACGDTASFCAGILPSTGVITYQWTITGGAIEGSATGPCVRIRTAGAQVTLHLEARRNNCATTCDRKISVGGFTCEVAPFDPSRALSCGDTASYCAALTPPGPATYTWTITGGTIETSPSGPCVRVKAGSPGSFTLSVEVRRGDCASSCAKTVPIGGLKCDIMAFNPNRVLACGDTASFCALITPGGGNLIYEWTIVGGTIVTPPGAPCVTVKAGSGGEFTLKLDVKRNNCTTSCDRSVPVGQPKCLIDFDTSRIFACGDTATFCARVIPGDGTITYEWTVLGGAILTPGGASCVTVKAGTGGQFTVMLTVRRNNCPTTCDRTLPIAPPSCGIVPLVTRALACGDTATYCASVIPSGGFVTYLWSASGGTLVSAADGACVTVQAGSGANFSLHLIARRNGCATECDLTAPIAIPGCAISPLVTRTLACGDSATYCLSVTPGGGSVSTIWSVRGGGVLNGDATGSCIQVQAAGTFTLTATVSRNGCSTTCEQTVVIDAPTSSISSTITSLCANDTTTLCGVVSPAAPNTNYAWTITGCGSILTSPTASCVKVKGCPDGGSFTAKFTATRGTCTTTNTKTITVAPPPPSCNVCRPAYPDQTHLPMSKGTLDADSVVKTFDPKTGGLKSCIVGDTLLRVFYSSDRVMLLGYRQVQVKTSSGTTITNFPVPAIPTTPMCIREPNIGDTIRTGDLRYGDWYERPVFPALWITDITANAGSRAGDWRLGVIEAPPDTGVIPADKVCGLWKYAVRSYDKTLSSPRATTISDLPDAPKNFWNLGLGSDTPTEGFAAVPNGGYGAEAAWNLTRLGLLPGHAYRLFFSLYEGGENPHPNLGCTNLVIPPTSTTQCLPAGVVAGDAEVSRKPADAGLDSPIGSVELLGLPHQFDLLQNQPNPFDRKTTISYAVPERSRVSIRVYTVTGQEVAVLVDGTFEAGRQAVSWSSVDRSGRPLQPGVYLYKLLAVSRSGAHQVTKKMVLLR